MDTKKKYRNNLSVTPLWESKGGNLLSLKIDDELFDKLQQIEKGGKLIVRHVPAKDGASEKRPQAYLEYMTKEDLAQVARELGGNFKRSGGNRPVPRRDEDSNW